MANRIFILEDNEHRNKFFRTYLPALYPEAEIVMHEEAAYAMNALEPGSHWDIIFLDHDLGGMVYVQSEDPNTGFQVAKHIAANNITYNQCIVHTQNPVGGKNISNALGGNCSLIPFPNLMNTLKHEAGKIQ